MSQNRKLQNISSRDDSRIPIPDYLRKREREKERRVGKGEEESARDRRGSITRAETQNRARAIGELKLRHAIYMATETIEVEWRWWWREEGKQEESRRKGEGRRKRGKERSQYEKKLQSARPKHRLWFLTVRRWNYWTQCMKGWSVIINIVWNIVQEGKSR